MLCDEVCFLFSFWGKARILGSPGPFDATFFFCDTILEAFPLYRFNSPPFALPFAMRRTTERKGLNLFPRKLIPKFKSSAIAFFIGFRPPSSLA